MKVDYPGKEKTGERIVSKSINILTRIAAGVYSLVILLPMLIFLVWTIITKTETINIRLIIQELILISNSILIVKTLIRNDYYGRNMIIGYLVHCIGYLFIMIHGYSWIKQDVISLSLTLASVVFLIVPAAYFIPFPRLSFIKKLQNIYWLPIVAYITSFIVISLRLLYDVQKIENDMGGFLFIVLNYTINFIIAVVVFVNYIALLFIIITLTVEGRARVKEKERCKGIEEMEANDGKMNEKYLVDKIYEADYGCEERPADYVPMDTVYLKSKDGKEIVIKMSDQELYNRNINEGDWIEWKDLQ